MSGEQKDMVDRLEYSERVWRGGVKADLAKQNIELGGAWGQKEEDT